MRDSERKTLDVIDNLMYSKRYLDANEQLENIKNVIPRVYYRIIKRKLLEATREERGRL